MVKNVIRTFGIAEIYGCICIRDWHSGELFDGTPALMIHVHNPLKENEVKQLTVMSEAVTTIVVSRPVLMIYIIKRLANVSVLHIINGIESSKIQIHVK